MNNFDWTQLVNPEFYITFTIGGIQLGLYIVLFIVFAGIYSRDLVQNILFIESDFINLVLLSTLVAFSGVFGNMVGYWFGAKSGYYLYNREDTLLFKKKYLIQSKEFFEKHGGKAIIYARFLPIVRTFAPIVAGIGTMDKKKFMFYNILSSFLWSFVLIFSGHYLYGMFLEMGIDLKEHIEKIVIGIILVSTLPVFLKLIKKKVVAK
jgi:membrane-associated protein